MGNPVSIVLKPDPSSPSDRIDRWLAKALAAPATDSPEQGGGASDSAPAPALPPGVAPPSRSRLKALILDGRLTCDGAVLRDPSCATVPGAEYALVIPPPAPAVPEAEDIPLDILHEDDHVIVLDKPAGMVTHPAPGNPDGTLVNALIAHCGDGLTGIGGERRPGIVHRLDKDTSGVMVAAKTEAAHTRLTEMFAAHDLDRSYTAIAWGVPREGSLTVDAPIGRNARDRKRMAVTEKGRHAVTHVEFTRSLPPLACLAECRLETGRTHQIRVHLASLGHGVVGDALYGRPLRAGQMPDAMLREALEIPRGFPRQALHARLLGFAHPVTGKALEFTSPLPADMAGLVRDMEAALVNRGRGRR